MLSAQGINNGSNNAFDDLRQLSRQVDATIIVGVSPRFAFVQSVYPMHAPAQRPAGVVK